MSDDTDPPEVQVGERLFLETRFAKFFFANSNGDVNAVLPAGDPVMDQVETTGAPLPGPFQGQSMNCRQCHLVDEMKPQSTFYVRSYCDFARRSPVPATDFDNLMTTPRNSPLLVNATLPRDVPQIFHFDGEFATIEDLVVGTFTGRNFGWAPTEYNTAVSHIANVIRNDNGQNALAISYGGGGVPFSTLFLGTNLAVIPPFLVIPPQYRIDVAKASDAQVLQAAAALIHAYVDSLRFSSDDSGQYNGSPYDVFLQKNNLPRSPDSGETSLAYSQRLLGLINQLGNPVFVTPDDGAFALHDQSFSFGATELQGLKTFFTQPGGSSSLTPATASPVTLRPISAISNSTTPAHRRSSTTRFSDRARSSRFRFPTWPRAARTSTSIFRPRGIIRTLRGGFVRRFPQLSLDIPTSGCGI